MTLLRTIFKNYCRFSSHLKLCFVGFLVLIDLTWLCHWKEQLETSGLKVTFKKSFVWQEKRIVRGKNLDLEIQCAVLGQLGNEVFRKSPAHLFEHFVGIECDHLSSSLKLVTPKYLSLRLKTYGKWLSQMAVHKNQPSQTWSDKNHIVQKSGSLYNWCKYKCSKYCTYFKLMHIVNFIIQILKKIQKWSEHQNFKTK